MNNPFSELYDIEGLDAISWWPLGLGWWIVLGLCVLMIVAISLYLYRKRVLKRKWQYGILNQMSIMERTLSSENSQVVLIELSQLIRRIAIHTFSRSECAGLEGTQWLAWLKANDPDQFDWELKGSPLVEVPYAPSYEGIPLEDIVSLIQAARRWIK